MRNLAIVCTLLFFAPLLKAQVMVLPVSDSSAVCSSKLSETLLFNVPMLGNISLKTSNYFFQELTLPFQVTLPKKQENNKDVVDSICAIYSIPKELDSLAIQ